MSDDGTDWEPDDELEERPHGGRPHGGRPHGGRPHGGRPHGGRPHGGRPHGGRPHGGRPHGGRPFGAESGAFLDPDEWSSDIAELFCERSAVVRLGATLLPTDNEVWVPAFDAKPYFRGSSSVPAPGSTTREAFRPLDHTLETRVAVPDGIMRGLIANSDLAHTLKTDLARALARGADRAFLGGAGLPRGVRDVAHRQVSRRDLLSTVRALLDAVRGEQCEFRNPGWVLSPAVLEKLSVLQTADFVKKAETPRARGSQPQTPGSQRGHSQARSLDTSPLLRLDGVDGGTLLGYPFVTSLAASDDPKGIYFAADWQDAWIGVDTYFVTVDAPAEPEVQDKTVIRASMSLDFALRRKAGFAFADTS